MIDYKKDPDQAIDYVQKRLCQVKEIFDDIAQETGLIYVAMPEEQVALLSRMGLQWSVWLGDAHKLIADRLQLANLHREWMMKKHDKPEEKS